MTPKEKAATVFGTRAASKSHDKLNSIGNAVWLLAYSLEESRQSHEKQGQHFRRLACYVGLALLRLLAGGLRHV
jgi:hypothetical protein